MRATTVVEVLESIERDDKLPDACRRVTQRGYTLGLDAKQLFRFADCVGEHLGNGFNVVFAET